jgi:hypothetical protein
VSVCGYGGVAEERLFRQQAQLERKKALEEKRREERTLPKFTDKIDACTNIMQYLQEVPQAPLPLL